MRGVEELEDVWFPADVPDEDQQWPSIVAKAEKGRFYKFLRWVK